jgi:hypothetical protein
MNNENEKSLEILKSLAEQLRYQIADYERRAMHRKRQRGLVAIRYLWMRACDPASELSCRAFYVEELFWHLKLRLVCIDGAFEVLPL